MRSVFSIAYGCGLHSLHLFLSLQPLQGSCRVLSVPFLLLRGAVEAASEESPRRVGMSPFWCLILKRAVCSLPHGNVKVLEQNQTLLC